MTEAIYERELGGIHEKLSSISASQERQAGDMKELKAEVLDVKTRLITGVSCPVGAKNTATLASHEQTLAALTAAVGKNGSKTFALGPLKMTNYGIRDVVRVMAVVLLTVIVWRLFFPKTDLTPVFTKNPSAQVSSK